MTLIRKILLSASILCTLTLGLISAAPTAQAAGPNPVVIFETTMGRIIIMLYPKEAPITVENFLKYVDAKFYDGTIFHRVIRQEKPKQDQKYDASDDLTINIVQGGGFLYPMKSKRTMPPIPCESRKAMLNKKGTIAMARGAEPDSATSQFFFNAEDNPSLDFKRIQDAWDDEKFDIKMGYCAFGKILRGMDVVEKMLKVKTTRMGIFDDVPAKPVYITKAYRAK
jgi:peptidyl-prolyl cis-trans isomerase A (cyclophilin A)/peptidyl-prolyl cis-trans isomerase B (cyclophilin B)